jgi:hypothetical protein
MSLKYSKEINDQDYFIYRIEHQRFKEVIDVI